MSAPGYRAAPTSLIAAADGIEAVVAELGRVTTAGRAEAGRGMSELELEPVQLGHDELAAAFASFCERWEWGVRGLVRAGAEMADGLRGSGRDYARADATTGSVFSQPFSGPDSWAEAGESIARTWSGVGEDLLSTGSGRITAALDGRNPYAAEIDSLNEIVD
ncbi:MAG: hypothetical protein ABW212_21910 [Pseudonocardia sediminis]